MEEPKYYKNIRVKDLVEGVPIPFNSRRMVGTLVPRGERKEGMMFLIKDGEDSYAVYIFDINLNLLKASNQEQLLNFKE